MFVKALRLYYNNIKSRCVKHFRTQEVIRALEATHLQELGETPVNLYPIIKRRQSLEIQAARDGKFPIVSRRSLDYPMLPETLQRLQQPILKSSPYNLRRFSETPVPRRAINLIKNSVLSLRWKIVVAKEQELDPERQLRINVATYNLEHPNKQDSWKTLMEPVLEDFLIGGYGCIELALTPAYKHPFKLWAVDGSTIGIMGDWTEAEAKEKPKYAQVTAMQGGNARRGWVPFLVDDLIYLRDNIRTSTPFGLGRLEVCFNAISSLLGAQEIAANAGTDQTHKEFLWFREAISKGKYDQVARYMRGEEGNRVNVVTGMPKPDVIDVNKGNEDDFRLAWQEFLIRIIGTGFDISPQALGIERDVNRSTSEVMDTKDFRSGVVPVATKLGEAMTRNVLHTMLDWRDLEFEFIGLNDPDYMTKGKVLQILYQMDSCTGNYIAEEFNMPKIEGGIGDLTFTQKQIMIAKAQAEIGAGATPPGGVAPGAVDPATGAPVGGAPPGAPSVGGPPNKLPIGKPAPIKKSLGPPKGKFPMTGAIFSAEEVSKMQPEQVNELQRKKMLPADPQELKDKMEENEPGILEKLSEELMEYFEWLEKEGNQNKINPRKVKPSDETEQVEKYKKQRSDFKSTDKEFGKRFT